VVGSIACRVGGLVDGEKRRGVVDGEKRRGGWGAEHGVARCNRAGEGTCLDWRVVCGCVAVCVCVGVVREHARVGGIGRSGNTG